MAFAPQRETWESGGCCDAAVPPWLPAFCSVKTPCSPDSPEQLSSSITSQIPPERHEIGAGHSPFWPEGKRSKSTSAPLLLMAHRASPWEQAASGRGRSSLYPVAAILPLGSSKPVPSCSQNQQGLCCPQQSWGCRHEASCTDCVSQPHFQPPPSTRMCGAH